MIVAEFYLKMPKGGEKDKMRILDKEGSLRDTEEYEAISLDPGSYNLGGHPYFF